MARVRTDWGKVANPRYWIFAGPGLALLAISFAFWGEGWWVYLLQFAGIALLIWPLQRVDEDERRTHGTSA